MGGLLVPFSTALFPLAYGLARHALFRMGVTSDVLRLANIPVHYYYAAGKPSREEAIPVVLIHGIADRAQTWAFVMRALTKIGPVYAIDLPGFGLSGLPAGRRCTSLNEDVAVVQELISTVIERPALVVGNSLGGWIAARLAINSPELTSGVVLLDPGGAFLEGLSSWEEFTLKARVGDMHTVRQISREIVGRRMRLPLYLAQHSLQQLFSRDAVSGFISLSTEDDALRPEELARLNVPVGLIWGLDDQFLPLASLEYFRRYLPQPQLLLLRGCGHMPQVERPRQVIQFIRGFAQRIGARQAEAQHSAVSAGNSTQAHVP